MYEYSFVQCLIVVKCRFFVIVANKYRCILHSHQTEWNMTIWVWASEHTDTQLRVYVVSYTFAMHGVLWCLSTNIAIVFGCGNQISLTFCSIFIQLSTKNSFGIKSEIDCSESCCYHKNGIRKGVKLEKFHRKIQFLMSCIDGKQGIIIKNINFK